MVVQEDGITAENAKIAERGGRNAGKVRAYSARVVPVMARWRLLICLAAVAVFWPCLRYGFAMDDFALIEAGQAPLRVGLRAHFVPYPGVHYRPLGQYGYFWLADRLFGYRPLPFHLANLGLHLLNVVLVSYLLARLVRDHLAAGVATLFFAVHAALFLVMAWAALAGEAIPLLCVLLALLCYDRYLVGRGWWWLAYTVAAVGAALLAKQVAVALPPALLLYQLLLRPRYTRLFGRRLPLAPASLALLAPLLAYAWFVLRISGPHESGPYRLVFSPAAIRTGLTYLAWTLDLPRLADAYPPVLLALVAAALVVLLGYAAWRRDRLIAFGVGWFALFLAPVIFLPEHMFHYYLYTPLVGAAVVVARLGELLLAALRGREPRLLLGGAAVVVLLAGNAVGVATERERNPTMVQAGQAARVLAVLRAAQPQPLAGAAFHFVAPADHVYYLLGYGAAVRLAYPGTPLQVTFEGITPPPEAAQPVYRYRWTGETVVAAP